MKMVAIILVNYNGSDDTIECIKSIENNVYSKYKIIIVDNNSNINEYLKLESYLKNKNNIKLIRSNTNLGFAGGNNLGIRYALKNNFEYILLLNNDTIVESNFLVELLDTAESEDSIGIVGGKILYYDNPEYIWYNGGEINRKKGTTIQYENNKRNTNQNKVFECSFITGCLQLIKAELIKNIGTLSEEYFLYYEDTDFCAKAKKNGWKLVVNTKSIIYHKVSKSTGEYSDNYFYYFSRNRLMFIKKNFNGVDKINAYSYSLIKMLYYFIKFKNINIISGINDFIIKKEGIRSK